MQGHELSPDEDRRSFTRTILAWNLNHSKQVRVADAREAGSYIQEVRANVTDEHRLDTHDHSGVYVRSLFAFIEIVTTSVSRCLGKRNQVGLASLFNRAVR